MSALFRTVSRKKTQRTFVSMISIALSFLFLIQPVLLAVPSADAKASDWGESVGNVLLDHKWGYGTSVNLTGSKVTYASSLFKLNTTAGSINTTLSDLKAGTRTDITITRYDALVLTSKGAYWSRKSGWDLPNIDASMFMPSPIFGDMDNDSDYDAYVGTDLGVMVYYNNTGTLRSPTWTLKNAWNLTTTTTFAIPSLADLDNDGDLDMLVGDNNGKSFGYNNTGSSTVPAWTRKTAWDALYIGGGAAPTLGDLDNDKDFDVIVGDGGGYGNAMKNTGSKTSPTWTNQTSWNPAQQTSYVAKPTLGDLDGDGDLDYLVGLGASSGNARGTSRAYENTGDATGPVWTRNTNWDVADIGNFACPSFMDLDGDGDLDVMVGETYGAEWTYENLGVKPATGTFYTAALDAGVYVNWSQVKWGESLPANTDVTLSSRTGNSTDPTDGSWSAWSASVTTPGGSKISSLPSRRIQLRATLTSTNNHATPTLWGMNVTYWRYEWNGAVTTNDFAPTDLVRWNNVTGAFNANGQSVHLNYSLDLGSTWSAVPTNGDLSAVSITSGHIRFRANLTTSKPYVTPELSGIKLTYMSLLASHHLHIGPVSVNVTVNGTYQFLVELHDINNNTLNKTLSWSTDIGTITTNGSFSARKFPGTGYVNVSYGSHKASAIVRVKAGPLSKIVVDPTSIITDGGKNHTVNATFYDSFDNKLTGMTANWTTGAGTVAPAQGAGTTYSAKVLANDVYVNVTGNVTATIGSVKATVLVTILGHEKPPPPPVLVLTNITISPVNATLKKGDTLKFQSTGLDQFGAVMNVTMNWTSDVGSMAPATGKSSTLTVTILKGNGTVSANIGELVASAKVKVTADDNNTQNNTTYQKPFISGRISDQYKTEDTPPWTLDLRPFERGSALGKDLLWHAEGVNTSLVRVSGEYSDNDILIFSPLPNAYGNDQMTLVLQDKLGNKATQDIWVNISPVDDPPLLNTVPDLMIHYDDPYVFNYQPYISDVDTPISSIQLAVEGTVPAGTSFTATATNYNITYFGPKALIGQSFIVTVAISDGTTKVKDSLTIQVSDNWVPAILVPLPDVTMREGETKFNVFNLDDHFQDKDKDVIYFTYGNNHVKVIINTNHSVDIEASSEWSGKELVTFRATDSKGALVEDDVLVTVIPRNDPPVVGDIPDMFVHYDIDTVFDLSPYISDVDTPAEQLTLVFSEPHVWWSWDQAQASAHPPRSGTPRLAMTGNLPRDLSGTIAPYTVDVTVTVSDGSATSSGMFTISVGDNWPPMVKAPMPDVSFDEDTTLTNAIKLTNYFEDPDGAPMTYSARSTLITLTIKADSTVDFKAPTDWNGVELVTFRAKDQLGGIVEDTIQVTVKPVNDLPTLGALENQTMDVKTLKTVHLRSLISDVDDDFEQITILVTASDASVNVFMSGSDALLYADKSGEFTVTVTVKDRAGSTVEGTFHVTVNAVKTPQTHQKSFFELWALPLFLIVLLVVCLAAGMIGYRRYYGKYEVDDAFVILRDGRLISHLSRNPITKKDEQVFGSMVAAIQMFIEDAFTDMEGTEATVQRMEFKGNNILIEQGKHMYLALMFTGTPGRKLYSDMKNVLDDLEEKHGDRVSEWDGDVTRYGDIPHHLMKFVPGGYTKPVKIESAPKNQSKNDWDKVDNHEIPTAKAKKAK